MNVFITVKPFFSIMTQAEYFFCHIHTCVLAVSLMPCSLYFFKECILSTTVVPFKENFLKSFKLYFRVDKLEIVGTSCWQALIFSNCSLPKT